MSEQSDGPAGNPLGGMDLGGLLESAQQMMAGMQAALTRWSRAAPAAASSPLKSTGT